MSLREPHNLVCPLTCLHYVDINASSSVPGHILFLHEILIQNANERDVLIGIT